LLDQKAPPAALIPIATRNFPVGAISLFKSAAFAGIAIIATPRTRPASPGRDRQDISFPSPIFLSLHSLFAGLLPACLIILSSIETGVGSANSLSKDKIVTPMFMGYRAAMRGLWSCGSRVRLRADCCYWSNRNACAQAMKYGA